jgi:hypothetical protein
MPITKFAQFHIKFNNQPYPVRMLIHPSKPCFASAALAAGNELDPPMGADNKIYFHTLRPTAGPGLEPPLLPVPR